MRKRTNPWPAFADLFSALLTVTFAGFIMLSGVFEDVLGPDATRKKQLNEALNSARAQADTITKEIKEILEKDDSLKAKTRPCGDGTCIDLDIHFESNIDTVDANQEESLRKASEAIKNALNNLPAEQRRDIVITIEGHTDSQGVKEPTDARSDYLFNWNLSASRAASVLYIFKEQGLDPKIYKVVSIGYADTDKLCEGDPKDKRCNEQNRRTTLQLRADIRAIEARLRKAGQ
jgi:flagellar motor protein MotB